MKPILKKDPIDPYKYSVIWWGKPVDITLYGGQKTSLPINVFLAVFCGYLSGCLFLFIDKSIIENEERNLHFAIEQAFKKCAFEEFQINYIQAYNKWKANYDQVYEKWRADSAQAFEKWKTEYKAWIGQEERTRGEEPKWNPLPFNSPQRKLPIWKEPGSVRFSIISSRITVKSYWPLVMFIILGAVPLLYSMYLVGKTNENENEKGSNLESAFEKQVQEKERNFERDLAKYRKNKKIITTRNHEKEKSRVSLTFLERLVNTQSIAWILSRMVLILYSTPKVFRVVSCLMLVNIILTFIVTDIGLIKYDSSLAWIISLKFRILFVLTGTMFIFTSIKTWLHNKIIYNENHWISKTMKPFIKKHSRLPGVFVIKLTSNKSDEIKKEELIMKLIIESNFQCFIKRTSAEIKECVKKFIEKEEEKK